MITNCGYEQCLSCFSSKGTLGTEWTVSQIFFKRGSSEVYQAMHIIKIYDTSGPFCSSVLLAKGLLKFSCFSQTKMLVIMKRILVSKGRCEKLGSWLQLSYSFIQLAVKHKKQFDGFGLRTC